MLGWLRRSRRLATAFAVVLVSLVLVGTTDWWHANDIDDLVPATHNHASHHPILKTAPQTGTEPGGHCYICHWLRSFQNSLRVSTADRVTVAETRQVQPVAISVPLKAASILLPSRAPPV
jgi:hypothetical protein